MSESQGQGRIKEGEAEGMVGLLYKLKFKEFL